jgi:GNAT superfamily N-acetyltransferase
MIRLEIINTGVYHYINAYSGCDRVGKLGIEDKGNNKLHINYVNTNIKYTGKGIATMMLNKVIDTFKGYEISLLVKPMPRDGENIKYRTTKGLVEFYKKFGFERTDDPCLTTMVLKNN